MKQLKLVTAPVVDQLSRLPVNGSNKGLREKDDERDQRSQMATLNATALVGRFRKCEADEPGIYFGTLECVLAGHDVEIQEEAIKPGTWEFPPTDYELRERCELLANRVARAKEREENLRKQFEERRRLDAIHAEHKALPSCRMRDSPPPVTKAELERREAEQVLARYEAAAKASARPSDLSVFELDPATWNG